MQPRRAEAEKQESPLGLSLSDGDPSVAAGKGIIQKPPGEHSVVRAVLMGALLPGAGQIFNGQTVKGVLFLILHLAALWMGLNLIFLGFLPFATWAIGLSDTERIARKINRGEPVTRWE